MGVSVAKPLDVGLPNALNVGAGVTYRRESFTLVAGEKGSWIQGGHLNQYGEAAPPGSQVFSGFLPSTAADVSRGNTAAYVDLETDLTSQLLVNAAARFENYSDFGSKLSSKVALRFQPATQVVLRASLSTGFRAPSLAQSYFGSRITNFRLDPSTGKQTPFEVGIFPVGDPAALALGAKPLTSESSVNFSGGLAWSPTDQFTATLDGYLINLNDRILLTGFIGGDSVETILASKGLAVTAGQYFTNIVDTRTKGIDLTGSYRTTVGAAAALTVTTGINYTTNQIVGQRDLPSQLNGTDALLVEVRDDSDRERASRLARNRDGRLLESADERAAAHLVLRVVPLGARTVRRMRPDFCRQDAVRCRSGPAVQRTPLVSRCSQHLRHLSRQEHARQRVRHLPVGGGVAVRVQRTIRVHARGADYREVGGRSGGYLDERERRFISTKLRAVREYLPIRRDAPAISRRRNARVEESVSRAAASGLVLR